MKYIAFKLKGFNYWVWFKTENVIETSSSVVGKCGWGKAGAFTEIDVHSSAIEGILTSDTLQYTQ